MTFNKLHKEYIKMCKNQEYCGDCKYNIYLPCQLHFGYEQGKKDAVARDYNTILIYEDTIRNMLLNANPENNLIEWVDLNGKLNAIAHIKHLIYDLEQ